ncbi:MAG: hypothetical protein HS109_14955 [Burkholderiales bacterium]|nr:hypothetical protein [Burkholderiales bacterium]
MADEKQREAHAFRNPDGSRATWVVPVPAWRKWAVFGACSAPGLALFATMAVGQIQKGLDLENAVIVTVFALLFVGWGYELFGKARPTKRLYSTEWQPIPNRERYKRAAKWLGASLVLGTFFVWALFATKAESSQYLWPAACYLIFGIPGVYHLTQHRELMLTKQALAAKAYYTKLDEKPLQTNRVADALEGGGVRGYRARLGRLLARRSTRYVLAVIAFGLAWYLAMDEPHTKNGTTAAWLSLFAGVALAWDPLRWLLIRTH